jgi:hypothetical protein
MPQSSPEEIPSPRPIELLPRSLRPELAPTELAARRRERVGRALGFLAPGLIHWLGNSLFAIQGHVQMLGLRSQEPSRTVGEIMKGSRRAQHALDLLRHVVAEDGGTAVQVGTLLPRLCELLLVPLRDHGVRIEYRHSSHESPVAASGAVLCLSVVEVVRMLVGRLPPAFRGELQVDLARQADWIELRLRLVHARDLLPFPYESGSFTAQLEAGLADLGARLRAEPDGRTLVLGIPPAPGA